MKKLLLFLGFALSLTMNAQVPSYVPTNGLVAYYPFNGNANDVSTNANNGVVSGATLTTDRFGNANSAYNFNGSTDFINVTSNNSLNFQTNNTFSLSYWIKASSLNSSKVNVIINKQVGAGLSSQKGWNSNIEANLASNFRVQNAPSTVFCDLSSNASSISTSTNYHITQVFQNGTSYLYVNGIQVSTANGCLGIIGDNSSNMYIGKPTWIAGNAQGFNGVIDDIGIWNRALTQQEITSLYTGIPYYSDTCNNVSGSLTQGLVGYWPFCGNANDDSGKGNNGTVNGATLTTDRFGNANSAYSFNGINNWIDIQNNSTINFQNEFSISLWLNANQNNINSGLIGKWNDFNGTLLGGQEEFAITVNDNVANTMFALLRTNTSPNTNFQVQFNNSGYNGNQWHLFTYVFGNNSISLYKNGTLVGTSATTGTIVNYIQNLEIGRYGGGQPTSGGNTHFNGTLDDIGIWNRALTQQEITNLYNANQCITNITVTDTLIINVGQLSYNNPVTYANNITIYPNPASTQVNIAFNNISDLNGGSIKIINSLGQQVATTPITTSGTNSTMQLATWGGSGMYFVQIINPQGQIVDIKKIILQ